MISIPFATFYAFSLIWNWPQKNRKSHSLKAQVQIKFPYIFALFFILTAKKKMVQDTCQQQFPQKLLYRFGSTVSVKSENIFSTSRATHLCNLSNNTWRHFPWAKKGKKKVWWRGKLFVLHSNSVMQDVKLL